MLHAWKFVRRGYPAGADRAGGVGSTIPPCLVQIYFGAVPDPAQHPSLYCIYLMNRNDSTDPHHPV
jgi:hypothetical protein